MNSTSPPATAPPRAAYRRRKSGRGPTSIEFRRNVRARPPHASRQNQDIDVHVADATSAGRHFLACLQNPPPATNGREARLLLVLGLPETRLYRLEITGGTPQRLLPPALDANPSSLAFSAPLPAPIVIAAPPCARSAYPPIAEALQGPGQILVCGKSGSTYLTTRHFLRWLKRLHPGLASRVTGSLIIDENSPNPECLLAKARNFHAGPPSARSPVAPLPVISPSAPPKR